VILQASIDPSTNTWPADTCRDVKRTGRLTGVHSKKISTGCQRKPKIRVREEMLTFACVAFVACPCAGRSRGFGSGNVRLYSARFLISGVFTPRSRSKNDPCSAST